MVVRLKDEETVNWLLSQLEQGQGYSADAADVLGASGQEWLIPRLEKTLFLKSEDEPRDENPGDVIFGTVSEYSLRALTEIVARSRILTPRLKSWFQLVVGKDGPYHHDSAEIKELLRKWWETNREPMARGDYRKLRIPPLWPDDKAGADGMDVPFVFPDYVAATRSSYVFIQLAAMRTIQNRKMATWLDMQQAEQIGSYLKSENSDLRAAAYRLLESAGDRGTEVFSAVFAKNPEMLPSANVARLLNAHPSSAAERARCFASIVAYDGTSYMANHKSVKVEAVPLLKRRLRDASLSRDERVSASSYLFDFADSRDIPFFEELLKPAQPIYLRESAAYFLCLLLPAGNPPASLQAFENDPDLGVTIKRYLAERAVNANRRFDDPSPPRKVQDGDLISNFSELFKPGQGEYAAYCLVRAGEQGIILLKLALTMSDDSARGYAAHALLEKGVGSQEEQDHFLAALVTGLGADDSPVSDFLNSKEDLHAKALPLLKQRVLDVHVQRPVRNFAALHAAAYATREDVPFFESLLAGEFPGPVRSAALHAIYRLRPPSEVPDSVKTLANDKDLGEVMRIYHYDDQSN